MNKSGRGGHERNPETTKVFDLHFLRIREE